MRNVNIADFQHNPAPYLKQVREGEEMLIHDNHQPVARIIPFVGANDLEAHVAKLAADGRARLPQAALPAEFWTEARSRVSRKKLVALVSADRDEE